MFCFKKVVVSESVLKTYTGILQGCKLYLSRSRNALADIMIYLI